MTRTATAWWNALTWAYSEGRLSKDEYDGRLENALAVIAGMHGAMMH